MKRFPSPVVPVLALSVLAWSAGGGAEAEDTKTARGTVTAVAAASVTVKVKDQDLTFRVDDKTDVVAEGAGTKTRRAVAEGKPGVKLPDVLKAGQSVEVTYHDMGGTLHASSIRAIPSAGAGSLSDDKPAVHVATGTVKSVTAESLSVSGAGGNDLAFTVDAETRLVGKGIGTKARPKGGKLVITEALTPGDRVSVTYHEVGGTMHATVVRLIARGRGPRR